MSLVLVCFVLFCAVKIVDIQRNIADKEAQLQALDRQIEQQQDKNKELERQLEVGSEIKADTFAAGEFVDVTATSKGKGFKGVIARHGQHRGPMSHGSRYHRRPGSMGACSSPSRVFKGKNLPGRTGGETVTIQNLEIISVDAERDLILVKGGIPGANGALVTIKNSVKKA